MHIDQIVAAAAPNLLEKPGRFFCYSCLKDADSLCLSPPNPPQPELGFLPLSEVCSVRSLHYDFSPGVKKHFAYLLPFVIELVCKGV